MTGAAGAGEMVGELLRRTVVVGAGWLVVTFGPSAAVAGVLGAVDASAPNRTPLLVVPVVAFGVLDAALAGVALARPLRRWWRGTPGAWAPALGMLAGVVGVWGMWALLDVRLYAS
jgi:hypothetical protein